MRYLRIFTLVLFVASVLFTVWTDVQYRSSLNADYPVLTNSEDVLQISVKDGPEAIFRGLSAQDATDGDLTDEIMVASVSHFLEPGTVNVKYVVFDAHNNSASLTRRVCYTDYTSPRFALDRAPVYTAGRSFDLLDYIRVEDGIDGDISDHVRVISNMVNNYSVGVYPVNLEVSNSCGDTSQLTLWVTVQDKENTALIQLHRYIVYIEAGEQFDPYAWIASVSDRENKNLDRKYITVKGSMDTEKPGFYQLVYSYSDGTLFGQSAITVVVTERQA